MSDKESMNTRDEHCSGTEDEPVVPPASVSKQENAKRQSGRRLLRNTIKAHPRVTGVAAAVLGGLAAGAGVYQTILINNTEGRISHAATTQIRNIDNDRLDGKAKVCLAGAAVIPAGTKIYDEPDEIFGSAWFGLGAHSNTRDWGKGPYYAARPNFLKKGKTEKGKTEEWLGFRMVSLSEASLLGDTPVKPSAGPLVSNEQAANQMGYVNVAATHTADIENLPANNNTIPGTIHFYPSQTVGVQPTKCIWERKSGTLSSNNVPAAYGFQISNPDPRAIVSQAKALMNATPNLFDSPVG